MCDIPKTILGSLECIANNGLHCQRNLHIFGKTLNRFIIGMKIINNAQITGITQLNPITEKEKKPTTIVRHTQKSMEEIHLFMKQS